MYKASSKRKLRSNNKIFMNFKYSLLLASVTEQAMTFEKLASGTNLEGVRQ